jgi:hypothetical protein
MNDVEPKDHSQNSNSYDPTQNTQHYPKVHFLIHSRPSQMPVKVATPPQNITMAVANATTSTGVVKNFQMIALIATHRCTMVTLTKNSVLDSRPRESQG